MDKGGTQTDRPTVKEIDDDTQGLTPERWHGLYEELRWMQQFDGWLVEWVLWHINHCKLFNAKSIFKQIISSISNNSVQHKYTVWSYKCMSRCEPLIGKIFW